MTERSTRGPFIARIHITPTWENREIRDGYYRSLAHVDAMLARAFTRQPPPDGKPYLRMEYQIVWTDGYEWNSREFFDASGVAEGMRRGGILRHYLWRGARAMSASEYPVVAESGQALARRLQASVEPDTEEHRNIGTSPWTGPSLMPDPIAAIGRLRDRYVGRRALMSADAELPGLESTRGTSIPGYPVTTRADVRYLTNFVSLALYRDVASLPFAHASAVWSYWRGVVAAIEMVLRVGDDGDPYPDNEGFWVVQLPALAHHLTHAPTEAAHLRNGLAFQPVGRTGERYPAWVQELRGQSGVYILRERQADDTMPVVYVGSSVGALYETMTRHLQSWGRGKKFWRGHHAKSGDHDPGLTYDRGTVDAAVIFTDPDDARRVEYDTIERLAPRDNLIGQAVPADDGWYSGGDAGHRPHGESVPESYADVPF